MSGYRGLFGTLIADALDRSDDVVIILEGLGSNGLLIAGMNDAFCRMSGYEYSEAVGKPFLTLAAEGADPTVQAKIVAAAEAAELLRAELLCRRRDGATYWFGFHVMPAGDPAQFGSHSVVLGRDITERLRAGEQQKAMQELLASVFTSVGAAVSIASEEGRFLMTNPKTAQLLGCSPDSLTGAPTLDMVAVSSRDAAARARQQQLADGRAYTIEISALRRDGSEFPAQLTSVMVVGRNNRRFRVITLVPQPERELPARVQVAGKLKLVSLDEIKTELGARWESMAERVLQSADHVLRRRLGPRDTFSRTDDHGFLVCFAELSEQEASFRAAMIAREIRTKLIGQGEKTALARVTAITTSLPLEAGATPSHAALARMMDERLNTNLAAIHAAARQTLQSAIGVLHCSLEPILGGRGAEIVASYVALPAQVESQIYAALAALPVEEGAEFDLDALRLSLAAECCAQTALQGSASPVFVELGFEVFDARRKVDRYLATLSKLDVKMQRRLTLMLSQLPPGLPRTRLQDCIQRVRPYCRAAGFELEELRLQPPSRSLPGGAVLAVSASGWVDLPDSQLAQLLATVHACGCTLLVRHVGSRDAAVTLRTLGVDLISMAG